MINYWKWLIFGLPYDEYPNGSGEKHHANRSSGISIYFNKWMIFHAIVGFLLMYFVPMKMNDAARSILLPLAGIFIGLTFAWGANAISLMQSEEINILARFRPGGLREYLFRYQTAILVLLLTMVAWGLAGLNVFESIYCDHRFKILYAAIEVFLFFLISLSIRECWHVVIGAQSMILYKNKIRDKINKNND